MSGRQYVDSVRAMYTAFGQGRISDILANLADDVTFIQPGGPDIPWSGTSHNPAEVGQFFARLDAAVSVDRFEPQEFLESGDTVVALGFWSGRAKRTGKPFGSDWAMVWRFRGDKVCYFQSFLDTSTPARSL
jgi:ketosteroid isomerase-like protein